MRYLCEHLDVPRSLERGLVGKLEIVNPTKRRFGDKYVIPFARRELEESKVGAQTASIDDCRAIVRSLGSEWYGWNRDEGAPFHFWKVTQPRTEVFGHHPLPVIYDEYKTFWSDSGRQQRQQSLLECLRTLNEHIQSISKPKPPDLETLTRDALLLYCATKISPSAPEYGLWYLYFLRFWDHDSFVPADEADRQLIYRELLAAHTDTREWNCHIAIGLPEGCLLAHLAGLLTVNPGTVVEEVGFLDGDLALNSDCVELDDVAASVERGERLRKTLKKYSLDLESFLPRLLLESFSSLDFWARRFLADQVGIPFEHEALFSLSRIAREVARGRTNVIPAQKRVHFDRALDEIQEFHREWQTEWFYEGEGATIRDGRAALHVKEVLDQVESCIRFEVNTLPVSSMGEIAGRKDLFYFALLIDHENFWAALVKWLSKNRPDLVKLRECEKNGYERNLGPLDEIAFTRSDGTPGRAPVYVAQPTWYSVFNWQLVKYVVKRLSLAYSELFGIPEPDFPEAYAYWTKLPRVHRETYKTLLIRTEEPDVPGGKGSQAVDHKIFTAMDKVAGLAKEQRKRPFYVIVSGDGGYGGYLTETHQRKGIEYQYWFFESQEKRDYLKELPEMRSRKLEDILKLEDFAFPARHIPASS